MSVALKDCSRPAGGIPPLAIHGDYMPWNLREDDRGQLWLLDWEHARWGPPMADLVRYIVAHHSLAWSSADRIATYSSGQSVRNLPRRCSRSLNSGSRTRTCNPSEHQGALTRRKAKDSAHAAREVAAFRAGILNSSNEGGSRARPLLLEIQSYCAKLPTVTDVRSSAR